MTTSNPAVPRLAATVLLLRDDPLEVLLVRRHAQAVFASTLVFPGGVVDEDDYSDNWMPLIGSGGALSRGERAIRIAGIRETFEETGLLMARTPAGAEVAQPERGEAPFREVVRASGGLLMLDDLQPYSHWITPEVAPRRFDTHFLLARAPRGQQPAADGGETVALEWARPAAVVERATDDRQSIMFPTLLNLMRLAESANAQNAIIAARERPHIAVLPTVHWLEDGTRMAAIPEEAGYGVTELPAP